MDTEVVALASEALAAMGAAALVLAALYTATARLDAIHDIRRTVGDAIVADSSIAKVADFKGKKIGYNPLSPSDFLLSYALKTVNLSEKDITPVSMTPEAVPAAMASGQGRDWPISIMT